jgi:sugar phosphate isomerase/epimerase
MAIMRALGVPIVNAVCLEPDQGRAVDQLATFSDLAEAEGMRATLEMMPGLPLGSLATAAAAIAGTQKPNLGLLLDSMHEFRSGATIIDIEKLDPATIFYVQLCDVPLVSKFASYGEEARDNRLAPGAGELPLRAFINAVPPSLMLGLEVPMLTAAQSGTRLEHTLQHCIDATRALQA